MSGLDARDQSFSSCADAPLRVTTERTEASTSKRPQSVQFRSQEEFYLVESDDNADVDERDGKSYRTEKARSWSTAGSVLMYRLGASAFILAVAVPLLRGLLPFQHGSAVPIQPVSGGPIPPEIARRTDPDLSKRSDSPTDICFRWAQQSAVVNGTLYLYGGEATTSPSQTSNTWNNDLLTLDLTQTWQIASPSLTGLAQPSGPPAVALGYLWNSYDSLYLYGGEFSDSPRESPTAFSLWEYQLDGQQWVEHSDPKTSSGESAPSNEEAVQRAAEGAGVSVPSLGRGFYFGGHQDGYTTAGWSQSVARIYLQSLLEFTYPGYANDQVTALDNDQTAGTDGNYRNITEGGLQSSAGFTERADGVLLYVPGFGDQGILLALAGGTNDTFTQMNNIDVYDIAKSSWYKQSTSGSYPKIRVNPCAVVAAAPDGSSYNIYMFGGQALQPAGNQQQYQDLWILTLPSFTWIEVDMSKQSVPYGRSGHTCNIWDGQMVMVGGYVGDQLTCDTPGVYVFDLSSCEWVQEFTALSPGSDDDASSSSGSDADTSGSGSSTSTSTPGNAASSSSSSSSDSKDADFNSTGSNNPLNQQPAQLANASNAGGLEGSYGYTVPQIIIDVIGGDKSGGATVTTPVVTATSGPLATGKPVTYTVTNSDGSTATETASSNTNPNNSNPNNPNTSSSSSSSSHQPNHPNIAAITVGTLCGLLALLAAYLAFCAYLYRKQLRLYKHHVLLSQRQARGEKLPAMAGLAIAGTDSAVDGFGRKNSSDRRGWRPSGVGGGAGGSGSESASYAQTGSSSDPSGSRGDGGGGVRRRSSEEGGGGGDSTEDLLGGSEPTFVGVLLNPRRSLKVVNRD